MPALQDFKVLGKVILGEQEGRVNDDQIVWFLNDGMAVFDMGLCSDLYQTALEQGIGTKLTLGESAVQCED